MVTSINGNHVSGMQMGMSSGVKVSAQNAANEKVQQQTSKEKEAYATSSDGDTLDISAANLNRTAKTFTGQSKQSTDTKDQGYTDSAAAAISQAAGSMGIDSNTQVKNDMNAASAAVSGASSASAGSSSSSSTSSLSSYSESELKEMLRNGEITQAEYDEEIESREKDSTAAASESTDSAADDAASAATTE